MAATNDITGDSIQTKVASEAYRNNYDLIFRKKKDEEPQSEVVQSDTQAEQTDVK